MNAFRAALNQPIGLVSPVMPLMLSYLPTADNSQGRASVAGGEVGIAPTAGGRGELRPRGRTGLARRWKVARRGFMLLGCWHRDRTGTTLAHFV